MPHDPSFIEYYAKRAAEYERIYHKPERQADLETLKRLCSQAATGHQLFELACGTGYWTQVASQTANSIYATDLNGSVLEIAQAKTYGCKIQFDQADAFSPAPGKNGFTAGMAMHWWSHLRKSEVKGFLDGFHRLFQPGSTMIFMDNRFVAGSSTPISRTDDEGNTYQWRQLDDGTGHEVLKNFPMQPEVCSLLGGTAFEIYWIELQCFWFLTYRLK